MELTFLGTGGGRFSMIRQLRQTGGMVLQDETGFSMHIDPGPGALVHARQQGIALEELDAVLVTHAHLDHCGDMHAIIEAMTEGGKAERGRLFGSASVFSGADLPAKYAKGEGTYGAHIDAALDSFHRDLVAETAVLEDGDELAAGPYTLRCIETQHSDPRTIAFRLDGDEHDVGFVSDTALFDGLIDFFAGCDALVINHMRPREREWKGHLNSSDVVTLLDAVDPDAAVLQHFGSALIYASVRDEVAWVQEQVDAELVAARDGMTVDPVAPRQGLDRFL